MRKGEGPAASSWGREDGSRRPDDSVSGNNGLRELPGAARRERGRTCRAVRSPPRRLGGPSLQRVRPGAWGGAGSGVPPRGQPLSLRTRLHYSGIVVLPLYLCKD